LKPGDVVVGVLVGAQETKVRPAVVIASVTYLAERPDAVIGILTTKLPRTPGTTDYVLQDWQSAGLRAESCFRAYVLTEAFALKQNSIKMLLSEQYWG
jgi:mRNA interferase MazF